MKLNLYDKTYVPCYKWLPVFAWCPRIIGNDSKRDFVWLEWIERYYSPVSGYEYRMPER